MSLFDPIARLNAVQFQYLPSNTNILFSPLLSLVALCLTSMRGTEEERMDIRRVVTCDSDANIDLLESLRNNSAWVNVVSLDMNPIGTVFDQIHVQNATEIYNAQLLTWNFEQDREKNKKHINTMIMMNSNNTINDAIKDSKFTPEWTKRLVIGALDLSTRWHRPFNPLFTTPENFTLINGENVTVPMMRDVSWRSLLEYEYGENVTGLVLPLELEGFDVVFVKPNGNSLQAFRRAEELIFNETAVASWQPYDDIRIPSFHINQTISVRKSYLDLGLRNSFSSVPVSYVNPSLRRFTHIATDVLQVNSLRLHEHGISKALPTQAPPPFAFIPEELERKKYELRNPFLCLVRAYGNIILLARVLNPLKDLSPY